MHQDGKVTVVFRVGPPVILDLACIVVEFHEDSMQGGYVLLFRLQDVVRLRFLPQARAAEYHWPALFKRYPRPETTKAA